MNKVVRSTSVPTAERLLAPLDEIALPVPGDQPFFNFRRPVMNADHVRNASPPVFAPCAGTALGMAESQPANHLRAQLATRHGVDRCVDGFMRNPQRRRFGMHKRQCAGNLLRRVARLQVSDDTTPQRAARSQPALNARRERAASGAFVGGLRSVAARHRGSPWTATLLRANPAVSTQLARKREVAPLV